MYIHEYSDTPKERQSNIAQDMKTTFSMKSWTEVGLKHIHITAGDEWRLPIYVPLFYIPGEANVCGDEVADESHYSSDVTEPRHYGSLCVYKTRVVCQTSHHIPG